MRGCGGVARRERWARGLVRLAALAVAAWMVAQSLAAGDEGRWWAWLEPGEPLPVLGRAGPRLTLALEGAAVAPGVAVLVDGRAVAAFAQPLVTVAVAAGQRVAVDARCCPQVRAVRVVRASGGVARPVAGGRHPVRDGVAALGTVRLRP